MRPGSIAACRRRHVTIVPAVSEAIHVAYLKLDVFLGRVSLGSLNLYGRRLLLGLLMLWFVLLVLGELRRCLYFTRAGDSLNLLFMRKALYFRLEGSQRSHVENSYSLILPPLLLLLLLW